jgi:hypothetical protein
MILLRPFRKCVPGGCALVLTPVLALAGLVAGCGEDPPPQPPSLDSPRDLATATRSECGEASSALSTFNDSNGRCTIGLVANAGSNRLAIADLGRRNPSLVDLDPSIPSATHLRVGKNPVDVESSADGTAAYTLSSIEDELTVVDLWTLEVTERSISIPGTVRTIATGPGPEPGGQIVAATDEPVQLWIREGVHCTPPDGDDPGCSNFDAEPTELQPPGQPSEMEVGPAGRRVYVVYQSLEYMSVFALPDGESLQERGLSCLGGRSSAPCEVRRVGLGYGCSDGVDSDGDGRADQRDPQCLGPRGAEDPEGIGRTPTSVCNDATDNDGDGTVDREDPECQSAFDDSEREPLNEGAEFPCDNGVDDDGDDDTDYPADDSCYGPKGRTESPLETVGFESVAVDRTGTFVYVVDRARSQLLVVDARRLQLIDAAASAEPSTAPFTNRIGIPVGGRPAAAAGQVSREVLWRDPDDSSHGIVRHNFGAYVASDNGRTYYVETVDAECEVREPDRDSLLDSAAFRSDSTALQNSAERACLSMPEFPLDKRDDSEDLPESCEQSRSCLNCLDGNSYADCRAKCRDFTENDLECRGAGREFEPSMQTRSVVNPVFGQRDSRRTSGRLGGRGSCIAPEFYEDNLRAYADAVPDTPRLFDCDSPLRPQPLTPTASRAELDADNFESIPRARLLREVSRRLRPPSEPRDGVTTGLSSRVFDFRLRDERWTVTWEGVLPNTDRDDGLLARERREVERNGETRTVVDFDPGGVDLCSSGVRKGDRLILRGEPRTGDDAPEYCSDLTVEDGSRGDEETLPDNLDPYTTFRIHSVEPDELALEPITDAADGQEYAGTLPTRDCYPSGANFAIRAEDEWVVRGESSGFVSERTSELDRCVERFDDETGRLGSRLETGDFHRGPYLSFVLYDGYDDDPAADTSIEPVRRPDTEFTYEFSVQRFFESSSFRPGTVLPSDIHLIERANRGVKLLVSDANEDFVWIYNFGKRENNAVRIR